MSTEKFYDELSSQYHLISLGWDEAVRNQGRILSNLIGNQSLELLDCSCGIGTQAIGLALQGHKVLASDLSSKAVERAKIEAQRLGANIEFAVADLRELETSIAGKFDAILSCDNSVPHLLTTSDLELALRNMHAKLKENGKLLISMRDYNQILKEKPTGMPSRKISDLQGTRIYMQTWDWKDNQSYDLELFLLKMNNGIWTTDSYKTSYKAWQKEEISTELEKVGFKNVHWLMPHESGYYQPIVLAERQ